MALYVQAWARMMTRPMTILATLIGAVRVAAAAAATNAASLSTVADIDKRCSSAARVSRFRPDLVFADVSDQVLAPKGQGEWREFRDSADLKGATEEGAPNTQAFVWRFPDGVLFVQMFFQSHSGDWAHYADHCFRADGSLARVTDTVNTFNAGLLDEEFETGNDGGVSRVRIKYFSSDGTLLKKKSRLLDLETRKPVKRSFMDQDDVAYRRISDVPFLRSPQEEDRRSGNALEGNLLLATKTLPKRSTSLRRDG